MLLGIANHLPRLYFLKFMVIRKEFSNTVQIFSDFAYREQLTCKLGNMKNKEQFKAIRKNDTPFTSHQWVRTISYFNFITLRTRLIRVKESYITSHVIECVGVDNPWVYFEKAFKDLEHKPFWAMELDLIVEVLEGSCVRSVWSSSIFSRLKGVLLAELLGCGGSSLVAR